MFAYCGNNPVNWADYFGQHPVDYFADLPYWGFAHVQVQLAILDAFPGQMVMEAPVICTDGSNGRIDILNPSSGDIWEIKHNSVFAKVNAAAQLERYSGGTLLNHPNITPKRGGYLPGGTVHINEYLDVNYWYAGGGIILYAFSSNTKPQFNYAYLTKEQEKCQDSVQFMYKANPYIYVTGAAAAAMGLYYGFSSGGGIKNAFEKIVC